MPRHKVTIEICDLSDDPNGKVSIRISPATSDMLNLTKNGKSTTAIGYALAAIMVFKGIDLENAPTEHTLSDRMKKSGLVMPGKDVLN